ncbi:sterol O-acyltransferase 1-like isoform X2 [Portunus trituberculatus]|uniref:sterol O-acyltransferase 1-like isoform X2 n=1 Tax=Portunus trituberculatus TaxID=210409 RepID=UPI001E1CCE3D|nr:sterol O-acyltransferase 1-like isoform X2 [Portunus trituberculatus]
MVSQASGGMNGDVTSPASEVNKMNNNGETQVLHNIYLRERFKDLHKSLESELSGLVEKKLQAFGEENLPVSGCLASSSSSNLSSFVSPFTASSFLTHAHSRRTEKSGGHLPSRNFMARPSLLKELLTVNHMESIYNIFVAILVLLFFNKVLDEIIHTGSPNLDLSLIVWAFGGLDRVIVIWVCMFTTTSVFVYVAFHHWAHSRHAMPVVYDAVAGVVFLLYLGLFVYLPLQSLLHHFLPPASSLIILCEQVRMFMKTWAFVRSNLSRARSYKKDDDATQDEGQNNSTLCPNFSHYLYFLFAPTLVYRDEYPRNETCDWRKVINDLGQVIGCLFYTHFLFVRFCVPAFQKFGQESFNGTNLLVAVFSCMFPGSLVLLCGFFAILHAWLNAFAEMLRFADRMFYKDWWNSTSYARFYRTWNCVVHDWLYEYVYRDIVSWQRQQGGGCSKLRCFPMMVVFFISSVVHEYILSFAFRFFYPVLLIMFGGFGVAFMFVNSKARQFNIFLWVTLIFGTGIIMCLYSMEWYARINCPPTFDGFLDYAVPRSLNCEFSN